MTQSLNIIINHTHSLDQFVFSEELTKQNKVIQQKVFLLAKDIYASVSDTEKKTIDQISISFTNDEKLNVKIKKAGAEVDYDLTLLNDEARLRSLELIRIVHELGLEVLTPPDIKESRLAPAFEYQVKIPQHPSPQVWAIVRLFRWIQQWYLHSFTLQPAIEQFVTTYFADIKDHKDLKARWQTSEKEMLGLADKLEQVVNQGRTTETLLFSREEIVSSIEDALANRFQELYETYSGQTITLQGMRQFKNEKKILELALRFEKLALAQKKYQEDEKYEPTHQLEKDLSEYREQLTACEKLQTDLMAENEKPVTIDAIRMKNKETLAETEGLIKETLDEIEKYEKALEEREQFHKKQLADLHETQKQWQEIFDKIPILDIPLEQLAAIPMNLFTEESLTHTWETILTAFSDLGELDSLDKETDRPETIKRTRYGDAYLHALQLLPVELKEVLAPLTQAIDREAVEKYVWSQKDIPGLKAIPPLEKDQKRRLITQRYIEPLINESLEALLVVNRDFLPIAEHLRDRHSDYLEEWAEKVTTHLDHNGIHAAERTELELTKEKLIDLMISSLDELGSTGYYLTGEQLARLQEARTALEDKRGMESKTESLVASFKQKVSLFEKRHAALEAKIAEEKKRSILMEIQIPDLEIAAADLNQEGFRAYIQEQEAEAQKISDQIAKLRADKGKKVIIPPAWQTELNRLKQAHIPMLKAALEKWESRNELIKPAHLMAVVKWGKRQLDTLTEKEIDLIQTNIEKVKTKINHLKDNQKPGDRKAVTELNHATLLLKQLEQVIETPLKYQQHLERVQSLEKEKRELKENLMQETYLHFADLSVEHLSAESLASLAVNSLNEPIMCLIWESVLAELNDKQTSSPLAELKFIEAVKAVESMTATPAFKETMTHFVDNLGKSPKVTEDVISLFSQFESLLSDLDGRIEEAKATSPSPIILIPELRISLREASPERLKSELEAKQRELHTLNGEVKKGKGELRQTEQNITNYDKIKDPAIKRKGGLQILQRKRDDLQQKITDKENKEIVLSTAIANLEQLLAGNSVELEESDEIVISEHQGDIQEISQEEWQRYEDELDIFEGMLAKASGEDAKRDVEKRCEPLRAILKRRLEIDERQKEIETLEAKKTRKVEKYQAEMQEAFSKLDPTQINIHALVRLPITPANESLVAELWNKLLTKCLSEGDLRHLDGACESPKVRKQLSYAFHYLMIKKELMQLNHPALQDMLEEFKPVEADWTKDETVSDYLSTNLRTFIENQNAARSEAITHLLEPTPSEVLFGSLVIPEYQSSSKKNEEELTFTPYEIENLKLLTKALESSEQKRKIGEQEKDQIQAFVAFAKHIGPESKALNAKLSALMDRRPLDKRATIQETVFGIFAEDKRPFNKIPYGISQEAVSLAMTLSYNFKTPQIFAPLVERLERLIAKVDLDAEIKPEDQFTRRELGLLQKCAKLGRDEGDDEKSLLTHLEELGVLERDSSLKQMKELSLKAQGLLQHAQQIFVKQIDYQDGDLVTNIGRQKLELAGRRPNAEEEMHFRFITPYCHGAKIFKDKDKVMQSHVAGTYYQDEFTLAEELCSEVWRLDVAALVPKNRQTLLKKRYGDNWQKVLQDKYQAIENGMHTNKHKPFTDLKNPWQRRINAGKADYIWGGHARATDRDFEILADQMLAETEVGKDERMTVMICSEFVTKATLAALVKLNRDLSQELGDYLIQNGETEKGNQLKTERNVLDMPYSKREKLKNIHPGRMIDLLVQRHCLKRLPKPQLVGQLLRPE